MAGYVLPSVPPGQGRGAPHTGQTVTGGLHLRPPQPTGKTAAGVQRPDVQPKQQPSSAAPGDRSAQSNAGTPLHAALSYASGGHPSPQQWLPAARPPQQAVASLAALQQWAEQPPRAPGVPAAPPHQAAGLVPGTGRISPIGPKTQQQPGLPSSQGAQLLMSRQQPWAAALRPATQANGMLAMHRAQAQPHLLPPPLRPPGSQPPSAGSNAPSGAVALQPSLSIAPTGPLPAAVAIASDQPRNQVSVTVSAVATIVAKPKGAKSSMES